jgi:hypothetical protein
MYALGGEFVYLPLVFHLKRADGLVGWDELARVFGVSHFLAS